MLKSEKMSCDGISLITYYDGLKYDDCPICRLIDELEQRSIKNILYELSLDPSIRQKFIESLGLCPYHAWLLLDIAKKVGDKLGVAVIYESVLKEYIQNLDKEFEKKCFICDDAKKFEEYYIDLYTDCIKNKGLKEYKESNSIFCDNHLKLIMNKIDKNKAKELIQIQKEKLNIVYNNLVSFINKHDYRNKEPIKKEESDSIDRTIALLKGYKNSLIFNFYYTKEAKKNKKHFFQILKKKD
jgi:hypothetical protein